MCIFHKWENWQQYETVVLSAFFSIPCKSTNVRQYRICKKCGKMQDVFVANKDFVGLTKDNIHGDV